LYDRRFPARFSVFEDKLMVPGTHALISWWTANVVPLTRRDRLVVFLAGILPDLDGLGMLYSRKAYLRYHHILCHNLLGCLVWTALAAAFARRRPACATLAFLGWHLHLACDYFGSGAGNGSAWPLPYLYPLVGKLSADDLVGPAWYWNPWQWPLNGWQNLIFSLMGLVGFVYIAVRLDRTWFEFVWPRMDRVFCGLLQRWFSTRPVEQWTAGESKWVRRVFLTVTIAALLACVVAGAQTV
jgi:inner membrane protein